MLFTFPACLSANEWTLNSFEVNTFVIVGKLIGKPEASIHFHILAIVSNMQLPLQHLIKWSRLMQWSDLHFTISAWDYFKSKEKCVLKGAFHNRQNFTSTSVRVVRWWLLTFCFENWGTINWDMTQAQKNAQRDNHYSANESKRNKSSVTSHSRCYSAATNGCLTSFDALPWICNDMLTSTAHMAMSPFAQMTTLCSWIEERELEIQT